MLKMNHHNKNEFNDFFFFFYFLILNKNKIFKNKQLNTITIKSGVILSFI